jgi:L-asparaginase
MIVSQCFRGFVDLSRYPGGREAAELGAISAGDMTVEAALTKMMVGLGRFGAPSERAALSSYLRSNQRGERQPAGTA